jgi:Xaa-Pro aminopeptidase
MLEQVGAFDPIPREEIVRRIDGLKRRMVAGQMDFAVILQNVDRFYFTGTMQKGMVVIPVDGEPMVFVEKSVERARSECPIDIVPIKSDKDIKGILRDRGILQGVAGFEFDVLPLTVFDRLKRITGVGRCADISSFIKEVRVVKSAFEIEQMRKSAEILSQVFTKARQIIREDVREIDLDAELTAEGRKLGHQGFLRMRGLNQEMLTITVTSGFTAAASSCADVPIGGVGVTPALPQGSSLKKITKGIPVLIDYGGAYNGYTTDETRAFVTGKLEDVFEKPYEATREIIADVLTHAKAGVDCTEVFARAHGIAKAAGLEDNFMGYGQGKVSFIGHGLGLEINELPVITGRHHRLLKKGMVFAFEPKFILPGYGAIGMEIDLVVTESGVERLTSDSIDLIYF